MSVSHFGKCFILFLSSETLLRQFAALLQFVLKKKHPVLSPWVKQITDGKIVCDVAGLYGEAEGQKHAYRFIGFMIMCKTLALKTTRN